MITTLTIVHVIVSILLIIVVLLQFGRGAEAGFFSDAGSQGVFAGPGQDNILTKITTFLAILFLGLALVLANLRGKQRESSVFDNEVPQAISTPVNAEPSKIENTKKQAPAATDAPATKNTTTK